MGYSEVVIESGREGFRNRQGRDWGLSVKALRWVIEKLLEAGREGVRNWQGRV